MPKTDPAFRPADWLFIARQAARKKYRQIFGGASGTMKHAAPLELDDLYHIGVIALLENGPLFQPERGVPLAAFLYSRVSFAIISALRSRSYASVSRTQMARQKLLQQGMEYLQQKLKRPPEEEEICHFLDLEPKDLRHLEQISTAVSSLEDTAESAGASHFGGMEFYSVERQAAIRHCWNALSDAEKFLLRQRLEKETLTSIASGLGVSHETVRRREKKAKARLESCLADRSIPLDALSD